MKTLWKILIVLVFGLFSTIPSYALTKIDFATGGSPLIGGTMVREGGDVAGSGIGLDIMIILGAPQNDGAYDLSGTFPSGVGGNAAVLDFDTGITSNFIRITGGVPTMLQGYENEIWWIAGASILTFLAFLIVLPLLVIRIPSDYFARGRFQKKLWADHHLVLRIVLLTGKNLLGYVFLGVGILMLVLPGQGILTILVGIMLLNFPGKYRLVRWIVTRHQVLRALNWIRGRAGRPPLCLEG